VATIVSQRGDKDKTKLCYAPAAGAESASAISESKQDATLRPRWGFARRHCCRVGDFTRLCTAGV